MEEKYKFIANLTANLPEIPSDSIISQTIHSEAGQKTILFGFAPGQELSEHTSSQPAMLYFVEGVADLVLGTDKMNVESGAWVYMQPNLPHSIIAKTRVVMLLLMF